MVDFLVCVHAPSISILLFFAIGILNDVSVNIMQALLLLFT